MVQITTTNQTLIGDSPQINNSGTPIELVEYRTAPQVNVNVGDGKPIGVVEYQTTPQVNVNVSDGKPIEVVEYLTAPQVNDGAY